MTEKSRFFNSTPTDERKYQAEEFAECFNHFLSNGVFHEDLVPELEVDSEGTDMQVYVEPGSAWIEGYMYINDANLNLEHDDAEATDDRIDRVVLRLDLTTEYRNIRAYIKKGTPASPGNAEPPALTRDDWQYELSLAQVLIPDDTGTIDPNNITDEREDQQVCGLVTSLISPDSASAIRSGTTKEDVGLSNVENYKQARSTDGYDIQKNGSDEEGVINFKT